MALVIDLSIAVNLPAWCQTRKSIPVVRIVVVRVVGAGILRSVGSEVGRLHTGAAGATGVDLCLGIHVGAQAL